METKKKQDTTNPSDTQLTIALDLIFQGSSRGHIRDVTEMKQNRNIRGGNVKETEG